MCGARFTWGRGSRRGLDALTVVVVVVLEEVEVEEEEEEAVVVVVGGLEGRNKPEAQPECPSLMFMVALIARRREPRFVVFDRGDRRAVPCRVVLFVCFCVLFVGLTVCPAAALFIRGTHGSSCRRSALCEWGFN